jgi:hypothetical protein
MQLKETDNIISEAVKKTTKRRSNRTSNANKFDDISNLEESKDKHLDNDDDDNSISVIEND